MATASEPANTSNLTPAERSTVLQTITTCWAEVDEDSDLFPFDNPGGWTTLTDARKDLPEHLFLVVEGILMERTRILFSKKAADAKGRETARERVQRSRGDREFYGGFVPISKRMERRGRDEKLTEEDMSFMSEAEFAQTRFVEEGPSRARGGLPEDSDDISTNMSSENPFLDGGMQLKETLARSPSSDTGESTILNRIENRILALRSDLSAIQKVCGEGVISRHPAFSHTSNEFSSHEPGHSATEETLISHAILDSDSGYSTSNAATRVGNQTFIRKVEERVKSLGRAWEDSGEDSIGPSDSISVTAWGMSVGKSGEQMLMSEKKLDLAFLD